MDVALLGAGTIARFVLTAWRDGQLPHVRILAMACRHSEAAEPAGVPLVTPAQLLLTRPQVILEAAGHDAVREYGPAILAAGISLIVMSVGALADSVTAEALAGAAKGGSRLYIPSGAVAGMDAVRAASRDTGLDVSLRTTKPAAVFGREGCVFRGTARQAASAYPKNSNVAATLALAGTGLDRTLVELWGDQGDSTRHEVRVTTSSCEIVTTVQSHASTNRNTSTMACFSAVAALQNVSEPLAFI